MQSLCKDPKTLFYYRKILVKHKLIQKQSFCLRNGNQNILSGLYHLPRFYYEYKSKKQILIEQVVDVIKKSENFRIEYVELKRIFGSVWDKMHISKLLKTTECRQYLQSKLVMLKKNRFFEIGFTKFSFRYLIANYIHKRLLVNGKQRLHAKKL